MCVAVKLIIYSEHVCRVEFNRPEDHWDWWGCWHLLGSCWGTRALGTQPSCFVLPSLTSQQTVPFSYTQEQEEAGIKSHYFPGFYGDFIGPYSNKGETYEAGNLSDTFLLVYRSSQTHHSLITLTFTAHSVSFVINKYVGPTSEWLQMSEQTLWTQLFPCRSLGRIVEALVEDFMALAGAGVLTVTVQNTGTITSDYSVSPCMLQVKKMVD